MPTGNNPFSAFQDDSGPDPTSMVASGSGPTCNPLEDIPFLWTQNETETYGLGQSFAGPDFCLPAGLAPDRSWATDLFRTQDGGGNVSEAAPSASVVLETFLESLESNNQFPSGHGWRTCFDISEAKRDEISAATKSATLPVSSSVSSSANGNTTRPVLLFS